MSARPCGSGIVIRPAVPADLGFLGHLEKGAFKGDRLSRRSFRRFIGSPSTAVLVCERGEQPVGYAAVLFRSNSPIARLYSIAILPDFAGEGLGPALLDAVERLVADRGAASIRLEVRADNSRAVRLYRRFGYHFLRAKSSYYEDRTPAHCFEKSLEGILATPLRSSRLAHPPLTPG